MQKNFHWIRKDALAGASAPGFMSPLADDLVFLREQNVRLVVNLTEDPPLPEVAAAGFCSLHFPIADMAAPTYEVAQAVCTASLGSIERGEAVVLHCRAGLGRTGTLLACCLVSLGSSAEDAVRELRRINQHFIQNEQQEDFVGYFSERLASPPANGPVIPPLRLKL